MARVGRLEHWFARDRVVDLRHGWHRRLAELPPRQRRNPAQLGPVHTVVYALRPPSCSYLRSGVRTSAAGASCSEVASTAVSRDQCVSGLTARAGAAGLPERWSGPDVLQVLQKAARFGSQPSACRVRVLDEGWSVAKVGPRGRRSPRASTRPAGRASADDRRDVTHLFSPSSATACQEVSASAASSVQRHHGLAPTAMK